VNKDNIIFIRTKLLSVVFIKHAEAKHLGVDYSINQKKKKNSCESIFNIWKCNLLKKDKLIALYSPIMRRIDEQINLLVTQYR